MSVAPPPRAFFGASPSSWWRGIIRLALAGTAVLALGCAAFAVDAELDEQRAIAALREGGQIVYLRHAARMRGDKEALSAASVPADYEDCSRQRNLTAQGREQALELGRYWRSLGIPTGRVYANVLCRTRDTALLAFGRAEVDPRFFDTDFLRRMMAETPADRGNTIIVSSDSQLRELTGVQLGFAEAALVEPDGRGGVRVRARLSLEDWQDAADPRWWDWF
jgi:hypothetical protein